MLKKKLLSIFFLSIFFSFFNCFGRSIAERIAKINLSTLTWEEDEWPDEDSFKLFLDYCLNSLENPQPLQVRKAAFDILLRSNNNDFSQGDNVLDVTTIQDLELIAGSQEVEYYLGSIIDRTSTHLGKAFLFYLLAQPTKSIEALKERQAIIKELATNDELFERLQDVYALLQVSESYILSFWHKRDPLKQALHKNYYSLSKLEGLNKSSCALSLKSMLGHYQRASFFGASLMASAVLTLYGLSYFCNVSVPDSFETLKQKFNGAGGEFGPLLGLMSFASSQEWYQRFVAMVTGGLCALSLKDQGTWARDMFFLDYCAQYKLSRVADFIKIAQFIPEASPSVSQFFSNKEGSIFDVSIKKSSCMDDLLYLLNSLKNNASYLSPKGNVLKAYRLFHEIKNDFEPFLCAIAQLDAYLSIAKLIREFKNKRASFCFAEYIKDEKPHIELQDFWNPFVDPDKVVLNTLSLGIDGCAPNIVLTGPNAGGKSTLLKSVGLAIILAQTFGIAPAHHFRMTPFAKIGTHLNIIDDVASGNSLFKAEVKRANFLLNTMNALGSGEFMFLIMDELFNGTTPNEGQAAAFSFASYISKRHDIISILATHFPLVTKVAQESENFENYKILISRKKNNDILFEYKLAPGISDEHIALDLLKMENFPQSILEQTSWLLNKYGVT